MDAHNHPGLLGSALAGGCLCSTEDTNQQVFEKLNKYIAEHPNYEFYKAYGAFVAPKFSDNEQFKYTWKSIKENVPTDKPVLIADYEGHSGCFNDVALDYLKYYLGMWQMSDLEVARQIKKLTMTDTIQLSKIKEDEGDDKDHYAIVAVSLSMNTKHEDYEAYSETVASNTSLFKSMIMNISMVTLLNLPSIIYILIFRLIEKN